MPARPLCGPLPGPDDAERRRRHSHAERGNEFLRRVPVWGKACRPISLLQRQKSVTFRSATAFLSPLTAILLAISCGLPGGYLDLVFIVFKKFFWNGLKNYAERRRFSLDRSRSGTWSCWWFRAVLLAAGQWASAEAHLAASGVVAIQRRWRSGLPCCGCPCTASASLLLAAGLGRLISGSIAAHFQRPRQAWYTFSGLLGLLVILAAFSSGWHALREYRAMAGLPAPPSKARNVILIVWDTVRASNLSVYGHPRNTTPNLARWARKGVRYSLALAPAPWTYPSHTSFFTGHWPFQLSTQWKYTLDAPVPTLAEHLLESRLS